MAPPRRACLGPLAAAGVVFLAVAVVLVPSANRRGGKRP
jgi:hypothetical protein